MQARNIESAADWAEFDEIGGVEIELEDDALATGAKRRAPELPESDALLVGALSAVARLRDTVDRLCVFEQARQMLENESALLDQQIAREQRLVNAIIANGRARMQELHARRQTIRRALSQTIDSKPSSDIRRVGRAANLQHAP